jgi:hypothetical protein
VQAYAVMAVMAIFILNMALNPTWNSNILALAECCKAFIYAQLVHARSV